MGVLDRIRSVLIGVLVGLVAVLTAAIVLGVLLRPVALMPYPTAEGRTIDHARNDRSQTGRRLHLPQHRVGITVSCHGTGQVEVSIGTASGSVAGTLTSCTSSPDGAAYVLSTLAGTDYGWRVQSRTHTRWAVTFSEPVDDGAGHLTP